MAFNPNAFATAEVVTVHRDGVDAETWVALGTHLDAAGVRLDFGSVESQAQPSGVLNPEDFIRVAEAGGNKNTMGIGFYQALVQAFRAERSEAGGDHPYFCVRFGVAPEEYGEYWEVRDLEVESLREFVRRVDAQLALIPTQTQQERFLKREMPFGIGAGVIDFCRRLLKEQVADPSQQS